MRVSRNIAEAAAAVAVEKRRGFFGTVGRAVTYLTGSGPSAPTPPPAGQPRPGGIGFGAQSTLFQGAVDDRSLKPWAIALRDFSKELTFPNWRAQLSHSRRIFANLGAVRGAVCERARLAVGQSWLPLYTGRNHAWGVKAAALLTQWMKVCDVRGGPYDFRTDLKLMSIALDRDGDFAVNLCNDNPEWPQIQLLPAHRIASRTLVNDVRLSTGPYAGYWLNNGTISNDNGRTLALNILGPQRGLSNGADQDRQISTFDCIHHYRPEWFEQGRGLSSFSSVLRDLRHMADLRDLEFAAAGAQGTKAIIVGNDTGEADENEDGNRYDDEGNPVSCDLSIETLAGGTIEYVRGGTGNDVKAFTTTRPSPAWIGLMDHLERSSFAAIGWPKEYALDMSALGGANTRAILDKCQYSIDERQADLMPVALRIICWVISIFIKNGVLEDDPDWFMWDFQLPGELSVDDGRDRSNDRDDLRAGLANKRRIFGKRGQNWLTEAEQRAKEVDDTLKRAEALVQLHPDFASEVILNMLESNTPNGVQVTAAIDPDAAPPAPAPKKKGS